MTATMTLVQDDFEQLLRGALPRAYRYALHLTRNAADAEDLVQEASLAALRGFAGFEPGTNFVAWFMRIELNAFYSARRRARSRPAAPLAEELEEEALDARRRAAGTGVEEEDPARALLSRLDTEEVLAAIAALPEEFRVVAGLALEQDLGYEEIAAVVGCPVGTVRSRLHRARRLLKERLLHLAAEHGLAGAA